MDVIRAIKDYRYYHSLTGRSREAWAVWRAEAVKEWGLDAAKFQLCSIPRR